MSDTRIDAVLNLVDVDIKSRVYDKISRSVAKLPEGFDKLRSSINSSEKSAKSLNRELAGTGRVLSNNEKAARLFLQRVAQFAVLLPTFATLNRIVQGSVKFLTEFDASLRQIAAVNFSGLISDTEQFNSKLLELRENAVGLAVEFGQSAITVAETIGEFVKAGFNLENSLKLAEAAALSAQVTSLGLVDSQEALIQATQVFGKTADEATEFIDQLSKAEDISAAEAVDFVEALRTGGNALATFSGNTESAIGLVVALRQQTRKSGREIGTFVKTLSTRIFAEGAPQAAVEGLGVQLFDDDGSARDLLTVLAEIKVAFDQLTESQQANVAKSIAGVRQFESFIATINSLNNAIDFTNDISEASGTALEKQAVLVESLSVRFGKVVAAAQSLATAAGDAGLTDFLSGAADSTLALLTGVEKLISKFSELGGVLTPLLGLGISKAVQASFGIGGNPIGAFSNLLTQPLGATGPGPTPTGPGTASFIGPVRELSKLDIAKLEFAIGSTAIGLKDFDKTNKDFRKSLKTSSASLKNFTGGASNAAKAAFSSRAGLAALAASSFIAAKAFDSLGEFTGTNLEAASSAAQTALQLSFLGKTAALAVGSIAAISSSFKVIKAALDEESKARRELATDARRNAERQAAISDSNITTSIVEALSDAVSGRTGQAVGIDFGRILKGLAEDLKSEFRDSGIEGLRDTLADPAFIRAASQLSDKLFENQEAIDTLRQSYDEEGKSSLNLSQQRQLLLESLGQLSKAEIEAADAAANFIDTLEQAENLKNLRNQISSIGELSQELFSLRSGFDSLPKGIDALEASLKRSENAANFTKKTYDDLTASLIRLGDRGGFSESEAFELARKLQLVLITGADKGVEQANAIIESLESSAQQDFARDLLTNIRQGIEADLQVQRDLAKLEEEIVSERTAIAEKSAEIAMESKRSLEEFSNSLLQFGSNVDSALLSKVADLGASDVAGIVGGSSQLPDAIQNVINTAFISGLEKSQRELQRVSDESANKVSALKEELAALDQELESLSSQDLTQQGIFDLENLSNDRAAKALELENAEREALIEKANALINVAREQKKANDDLIEAEKKRLELERNLADSSDQLENSLRESSRAFREFENQKIAELFDLQASAAEELQAAQQGVLESTENVAQSYQDFIQSILNFNGAVVSASIESNKLEIAVGKITGSVVSFQDELSSIESSFTNVLQNANISLSKRIELEQQLAQETLAFLQQAQNEIVNAGLGIFGQSAQENNQLAQGIAGLEFIAEQLGGTFENFLTLTPEDINSLGDSLLNLPVEFKDQILQALNFLPSTATIGGFSVDQLKTAIGQVGAGVSPEAGLPSIEELSEQQVDQLQSLQDLAIQDAELQIQQVIAARDQLEASQAQLDAAQILEQRAVENLQLIQAEIVEERAVLEDANDQRIELTGQIIAAQDANTLKQIEKQAQLFAEQNQVFTSVGDALTQNLAAILGAKLSQIEASSALNAATGFIPNFSSGNLSPREAAGLLRAASREKRAMPAGAGLAVANTSEAIIPMRNSGFIPNFQEGNISAISAGIQSAKSINEAVVAAISQSIISALSDVGGTAGQNDDLLQQIASILSDVENQLQDLNTSNTLIQTNTATLSATGGGQAPTATAGSDVSITLQTSQNNTISVSGLESLTDEIRAAVREAAIDQADAQIEPLLEELDSIFQVLRERGLITSFGQPG